MLAANPQSGSISAVDRNRLSIIVRSVQVAGAQSAVALTARMKLGSEGHVRKTTDFPDAVSEKELYFGRAESSPPSVNAAARSSSAGWSMPLSSESIYFYHVALDQDVQCQR